MTVYRWPRIRYVPGENPWATYFKRQTLKRNNCINCIVTGGVGSGKSWATLSQKHAIEPDTALQECFFFKAGDFFQALLEYYTKNPKWKRGKFWALDEAGIDLDALSYYNDLNRGMARWIQTSRHRNYILMMTVPQMRLVSKSVRTIMNVHWKADGWIPKKNETKIIPRVIEYNDEYDKIYKKRLMIMKEKGNSYVNQINLPKPPQKVVKEYEKLKTEFTTELMIDVAHKIKEHEESMLEKSSKHELTARQKEILSHLKRGLIIREIGKELSVDRSIIGRQIALMRKKGLKITPVKEKTRILRYEIRDPLGIEDMS